MQWQQRAVIVGGGIMGADIAAIFAAGSHAVDVVQRPGKTRDSLDERIAKAIAQLGELERLAPPDIRLAGNSSGYPIRRIGMPEGGRRKQLA
jgi:prephenate dehydrogenase